MCVPSYYDDYPNAITISNDKTNSVLNIHYDETTQAIEKRLENLTDTLTIDDVVKIDLVVNATTTLSTICINNKSIK